LMPSFSRASLLSVIEKGRSGKASEPEDRSTSV